MMSFNELCNDFNERKPRFGTESRVEPLTDIEWINGTNSSNDLLVKYLRDNGIEYLRDFGGTVWFLYNGNWTNSKINYDRQTNIAHFFRCVYEVAAA